MTETQALLRLQEIDLELSRIETRAKNMPQTERLSQIDAALKKLGPQINAIVGKRKDLEMEFADRNAAKEGLLSKQAELQAVLSSADAGFRSIKDYETQLSALAKGIEKAAFDESRIETELERAERAEANALELKAKLTAEAKAQRESLAHDAKAMRDQAQELLQEREKVAASIAPEVQLRYVKARKRFGVVAVETLKGNVPSGCRVALRPSDYQTLRRMHVPIADCPYCERLLVLDDFAEVNADA